MEKEDIGLAFFLIGLTTCIFLFIFSFYVSPNEIIDMSVLDEACHKIYGNDYFWHDNEWGVETRLVCKLNTIANQTNAIIIRVD